MCIECMSGLSRGLGRRIHGSVEDTKLSTNKQHTLSLSSMSLWSRIFTSLSGASSRSLRAIYREEFKGSDGLIIKLSIITGGHVLSQ
jgi:hypothetical protein